MTSFSVGHKRSWKLVSPIVERLITGKEALLGDWLLFFLTFISWAILGSFRTAQPWFRASAVSPCARQVAIRLSSRWPLPVLQTFFLQSDWSMVYLASYVQSDIRVSAWAIFLIAVVNAQECLQAAEKCIYGDWMELAQKDSTVDYLICAFYSQQVRCWLVERHSKLFWIG